MDFAVTRAPLPETKCAKAQFLPPPFTSSPESLTECWRRNREAPSWFVQEGVIERAEETLECFRVVFQDPSNWASTFAASFKLPSRSNHVLWTGEIATKRMQVGLLFSCVSSGVFTVPLSCAEVSFSRQRIGLAVGSRARCADSRRISEVLLARRTFLDPLRYHTHWRRIFLTVAVFTPDGITSSIFRSGGKFSVRNMTPRRIPTSYSPRQVGRERGAGIDSAKFVTSFCINTPQSETL